ncbi:hypothetical protein HN446_01495 [bacterium]|nr:hypothetical protein [bacterium]
MLENSKRLVVNKIVRTRLEVPFETVGTFLKNDNVIEVKVGEWGEDIKVYMADGTVKRVSFTDMAFSHMVAEQLEN